MTLRVLIQLIPYGDERDTYNIARLDISNIGEVENLGFGHSICNYSVKLQEYIYSEWQDVGEPKILERHDRRDGAIELARRACELVESL